MKLQSYFGQIIKGYGYERDKKYIEHNTGDLNVINLHFREGVQSNSEQKPFICFDSGQKRLTCLIIFFIILILYIKQNTGDLNAVILHFRAGAQSDSEQTPFMCLVTFLIILVFICRLLMAIRNLTLTYIG